MEHWYRNDDDWERRQQAEFRDMRTADVILWAIALILILGGSAWLVLRLY